MIPIRSGSGSVRIFDPVAHCYQLTTLRLLKSPPTDWYNFYTALKLCQGISANITTDQKTFVTVDLQLYIQTMQLYFKRDIGGDNFVSIYGELHVIFSMSRAIGKYMENSGLNKRLSYCGIYNPLAVGL